MMNDIKAAMDLMRCFQNSVINYRGEFIAALGTETYFNFYTCEDEKDVKCKVLEWLSRSASKGQPFR